MSRFNVTRYWAFILALVLAFGAIAGASHPVSADGSGSLGLADGDGGGGGVGSGGGTTIGDPDVPTGVGKGAAGHGAMRQPAGFSVTSRADANASMGAWMIRLRLVLQAMRMRWLGI